MLEIKLNKTALRLDFSFFAVMSLFFFFDKTGIGLLTLCAVSCHELGHLIVITAVGARADNITLYGAGIRISASTQQLDAAAKAAVLSAGCVTNLTLCIIAYLLNAPLFSAINAVMCLFNLLPFGELDGALLARLALGDRPKILCTLRVVAAALTAAALILLNGRISITFIITCAYILMLSQKTR
ncbi:MAG: hypothetical protein E7478_05585 [Ruminococcaceae bacterium]|nr:hypothetical protein [Oscillospiraceae bacterium]